MQTQYPSWQSIESHRENISNSGAPLTNHDTLRGSELFSSFRRNKDSRFWVNYERIVNGDEEFLERYSGNLNVQLIFVCLVNQDFIHFMSYAYPIGWSIFQRLERRLLRT